ncbi:Asparagine synthase [Mycena indigotica]|uniref:Asparagine synthase n=1 Tax=Mycena indigotica TaxID=2126181 RepID=A0A8H6T322_9AGAR|nr:Asparagine synthase [Mycena indigotica]KAF7310131.1 Asparagine synthase [Mycena indigotica]
MCGLTSVFYPDGVTPPPAEETRQKLEASCKMLVHRGPDSEGTYVSPDGRLGFGHTRLSIIDLKTGQQPLSDEEEYIHCIVNGEIYDHDRIRAEMVEQGYVFKTKSDSELVVQLYKRDGFNCLRDLRGEWAFVLYDARRRLVFAARDRLGIRPLHYTYHNGAILFASEIKAFIPLGWKPEWDIESIVDNGEFADERTTFKGVSKLAAGFFAVARAGGTLKTEAYWDLSYSDETKVKYTQTVDEMIETTREHLVKAVQLRLRSDVPLAFYLSGGIDSSTVAGISQKLLKEKNPDATITVFTLHYIEDPSTDESPLAEHTAEFIGANLVKVPTTEALLVEVLEDTIYHGEQPSATFHACGKTLLSRAVKKGGFKVVLTGEGSDEIFGGYPWFGLDLLQAADPSGEALGLDLPNEKQRAGLRAGYQAASGLPARQASEMAPERANAPRPLTTTASHLVPARVFYGVNTEMLKPEVVAAYGAVDVGRRTEEGVDARVREMSISGRWHPMHVSQYITTKTLLTRAILSAVGDRADMMNSIESRAAFLDHHLVDYVNSLPASLKMRPIANAPDQKPPYQLTEKWILRQAAKPFISNEVYERKKVIYNPPPAPAAIQADGQGELLPLQKHLKQRITKETVERLGFIRWDYIKEQLDAYLDRPAFLPKGAFDPRGGMLMAVLSYVVLQERFGIPTYVAA